MDSIVKKKGGVGLQSAPSPGTEAPTQETVAASGSSSAISGGLEPRDRAEALRRLAVLAEFFRKTEPHSPVSYLVQRAARWCEMPLEEWLQEVIKNDGVLREVRETLGITQGNTK